MREILKPILTHAEAYNDVEKHSPGGPKLDKRPTYEVAKVRLINEIEDIELKINEGSSKYIIDDVVLNLRMRVDRSSKSEHPHRLLRNINVKEIGTKKWSKKEIKINSKKNTKKEEVKFGKDIFLKVSKKNLHIFKKMLKNDLLDDADKDTIRSIDSFYYDDHRNILNSFNEEWESGRIEVILHPFYEDNDKMLEKFFEILREINVDLANIRMKQYDDGPIFISMKANRNTIDTIAPFNPLRSIHPLQFRSINESNLVSDSKELLNNLKLSDSTFEPSVTVGVFDGGIPSDHPILKRFVKETDLSILPKDEESIKHGLAVCSALLFDDLKNLENNILPYPTVNIESFRVLPLKDSNDVDLYEIIDYIEEIVPKRKDIKVFNLSLGPWGPIEDDSITRFTYSLDKLSKDGDRIFVVAVGNEGEASYGQGRIQAPADSVNNIAVGCYCYDDNKNIVRASYSCYGDGREGAKVKPDVVEYGGTSECNMKFIGLETNEVLYDSGTSYAAPIVSRKIAEILGYTSIKSPLTSKALLIQTSNHPNNKPDKHLGYGVVKDNYLDILECENNKITVIYESSLLRAKKAKLMIPLVKELDFKGKVEISWTICVNTDVDSKDTDDYTNMSILDTFYPNKNKYLFTHPNTSKSKTIDIAKNPELANEYYEIGWKKASKPKSKSHNGFKYLTEQELRNDFKWDTVIKRTSGKIKYNDLAEPYIVIHALSRDKESIIEDKVSYSIALTIEYIDCEEDVYNKTINRYSLLEKAEVEVVNEIRLKNS